MRASLVVQEYMKRTYNVPPHVPRDLAPSIFDPDSSSSASRSASK